jgi:stage IV sporulation protein FB
MLAVLFGSRHRPESSVKARHSLLRSWRLGTAFGIPVYVHPTFLLAPALVLVRNGSQGGWAAAAFLLGLVLAVFGCVLLHEFGHVLMARRFGVRTRDVTLYPIGGVARLEGMGSRPVEELLIALAGPAVNVAFVILLAPLAFLASQLHGPANDLVPVFASGAGAVALTFALCLWWVNVALALFNLLPAFPMDGGRVFRALLALGLGRLRATEVAATVGMAVAFVAGGLGLYFGNVLMPVLALYVATAGQAELIALRREERRRSEAPAPALPVTESGGAGAAGAVQILVTPVAFEPRLIYSYRTVEVPLKEDGRPGA